MAIKRQVAVLGLGRFGQAVARELTRLGHEVLAVDSSERIIQDVVEDVTHAAQADVTDEDALRELGLGDFDAAIVAVSIPMPRWDLQTAQSRDKAGMQVPSWLCFSVPCPRGATEA